MTTSKAVTPKPPVPTKFNSWLGAMTWASAVTRSGRFRAQVRKINGRWCAWIA